jgi:hypothetical protein
MDHMIKGTSNPCEQEAIKLTIWTIMLKLAVSHNLNIV